MSFSERIILYSKEDYPLRHIGLSSFENQMNLFFRKVKPLKMTQNPNCKKAVPKQGKYSFPVLAQPYLYSSVYFS